MGLTVDLRPEQRHGQREAGTAGGHLKGIELSGDLTGPLISAAELERCLAEGSVVLLDARGGPDAAARFAQAAIPGARRVDLETDLSAPFSDAAVGGRHPLPAYDEFVQRVGSWGIGPQTPVVLYDDKGGGNAAARGWWMLRAIGLQHVAVLDGGCQHYPHLTVGNPAVPASTAVPPEPLGRGTGQWQRPLATIADVEQASRSATTPSDQKSLDTDRLPAISGNNSSESNNQSRVSALDESGTAGGTSCGAGTVAASPNGGGDCGAPTPTSPLVLDVREAFRYRGDSEPIDLVAGHIPGAVNCPFLENLAADGRFLPPAELQVKYSQWLAGRSPADLIVHCGSGVTACHTLLALEIAGLHGARLYVGSWSQWSRNDKPIATGS